MYSFFLSLEPVSVAGSFSMQRDIMLVLIELPSLTYISLLVFLNIICSTIICDEGQEVFEI